MTSQEAIKELSKRYELGKKEYNKQIPEYVEALRMAIEALEQQESEQWIPVSERLPEEPKENPLFDYKPLELYLVCEENMDYPCRVFWNGKIFTDGFMKVDAIAWRTLPAPYRD